MRLRLVVDDGDVEAVGGGRVVAVGDLHREAVGRLIGTSRVGCGAGQHIAVAHRAAGRRAGVAVDGQRPVRAVDHQIGAAGSRELRIGVAGGADLDGRDAVRRSHREGARLGQRCSVRRGAGRQIALVDGLLAAGHIQAAQRDAVVRAVDRDHQLGRRRIAVAILHRVVEGVVQMLPRRQGLDRGLRRRIGLECIGVAAVPIENERAVGAGEAAGRGHGLAAVRTCNVVAQHAGSRNNRYARRILADVAGVVLGLRNVVLDIDRQGRIRRRIAAVRHRDREVVSTRINVLTDLRRRIVIRRGQRVVIAIGDRVAVDHRIGADDQRSVGAVNSCAGAVEGYRQRSGRVDTRDRHGLDVARAVRIGQRECAMRHFARRVRIRTNVRKSRLVHKVVAGGNVGFACRWRYRYRRRGVLVNMHIDGAGDTVTVAIGQVGREGQIRIC